MLIGDNQVIPGSAATSIKVVFAKAVAIHTGGALTAPAARLKVLQ